jgi:DNA-binding CsgD family transcriptional regulator
VPLATALGDQRRAEAARVRATSLVVASAADADAREDAYEVADPAPDVVAHAQDGPPESPRGLGRLTARERQIAELVAQGLGNQAIATRLYVSRRTVEAHLSTIYRKYSLHSRSALAALVLQA